jgi:hypothetical protein
VGDGRGPRPGGAAAPLASMAGVSAAAAPLASTAGVAAPLPDRVAWLGSPRHSRGRVAGRGRRPLPRPARRDAHRVAGRDAHRVGTFGELLGGACVGASVGQAPYPNRDQGTLKERSPRAFQPANCLPRSTFIPSGCVSGRMCSCPGHRAGHRGETRLQQHDAVAGMRPRFESGQYLVGRKPRQLG